MTRTISSGPAISESEIRALEGQLGHPLPSDYRDFLLKHNARQIRPCVLPTPTLAQSEKVVLHQLTCCYPNTTADFGYRLSTYEGRIPESMLPIASDPGGNLFLLDLSSERAGRIYFWERAGEAEEGEEPTMNNVVQVAASFTELLSRLVDE